MRDFEELEVWKISCQLACRVYQALRGCKDYGLLGQMTRAAVSIPSNIAEGSERGSDREFVQFLYVTRGSAAELRTQIYIAGRLAVLTKEQVSEFALATKRIARMLFALITRLEEKA